jgi:soluble lytic murein transglycosylase
LELLFPRPYKELVEEYAMLMGISPPILFALIRTESAFQSEVISHAGAVGLTQLMPATAQEMADRIRRVGGPDYAGMEGGLDLKNPEINVHIGTFYLNYLMERFDDELLSLLAYNGGMNRVRRWRNACTLPDDLFHETISFHETRDYGRKVLAAAAVYEHLYYREN